MAQCDEHHTHALVTVRPPPVTHLMPPQIDYDDARAKARDIMNWIDSHTCASLPTSLSPFTHSLSPIIHSSLTAYAATVHRGASTANALLREQEIESALPFSSSLWAPLFGFYP